MAGNYNKVILLGNLTRDIELKHLSGDMSVGSFGLAVNRRFRTRDGENREEVTFVDCEAWGRTAEVMGQYLQKGRPVFIEGRLKLDTWEDKDGGKRSKLKVVVENFQFVDSKQGGEGGGPRPGGESRPAQRPAGKPAASGGADPMYEPIGEDDIPF